LSTGVSQSGFAVGSMRSSISSFHALARSFEHHTALVRRTESGRITGYMKMCTVMSSTLARSRSKCWQYGQFGSEKIAISRRPLPRFVVIAESNGSVFQSIAVSLRNRVSVKLSPLAESIRLPITNTFASASV